MGSLKELKREFPEVMANEKFVKKVREFGYDMLFLGFGLGFSIMVLYLLVINLISLKV